MPNPTVDENFLDSVSTDRLIGKCPIIMVDITGFKVRCLVDTGSTVSTLTESFYNQFLKESTNLQTDISVKLKAANGICIPYVGYIEVDMNVMGQNLYTICWIY